MQQVVCGRAERTRDGSQSRFTVRLGEVLSGRSGRSDETCRQIPNHLCRLLIVVEHQLSPLRTEPLHSEHVYCAWRSPARRLFALVLLVGCGLGQLIGAGGAQADALSFNPCNGASLSQPFAPWGDFAWYELAPDGDFHTANWTLSNGAQIVAGSEPYAATGKSGTRSLSLVPGASAQSPVTDVDAAYPSVRFFIAGTGSVTVGLVYEGLYLPAGVAVAGGYWQPSAKMLTASLVPGLLADGCAPVSVQITGLSGSPLVDDVFVDPWNRG